MNSITLTKPDGTEFQVYDRRSSRPSVNNFQTHSGYIETGNPEMMLPTGFTMQANGTIETQTEHLNRKTEKQDHLNPNQADSNILLPIGIRLEN